MYLTYLVIFVQTLGEIISQELFLSSLLDLLSKKKKFWKWEGGKNSQLMTHSMDPKLCQ